MAGSNKKTSLYDVHVDLRAKIVDYHGFLMPLEYSTIISEHRSVRNSAGLFDISHMGEIVIEGEGATEEQQIEAWQYLHDTGHAYKLQGWYGRTARDLINEGIIKE